MDRSVGEALDSEITAFAATYRDLYAPRPGALVGAGPTPRLSELKTSYDALAYHFARYRRRGLAEPLPNALASTVRRNAVAAQKRIQKTQAAQEAAKGAWPTCRGPLGSRDAQLLSHAEACSACTYAYAVSECSSVIACSPRRSTSARLRSCVYHLHVPEKLKRRFSRLY